MAITQDDFKKVWASTSSVPEYTFSDTDYKNGWEFVGNLPPTRAMWDELQRKNDEKMQFLQEKGSMCFDSVAGMKSSDLYAGQTVFTKGYYTVNDGGSAVYTIRAKTQEDVDDGGAVIFLDNGNVAELMVDGIVNIRQYGAKGDGATNDFDAFENCATFARNKYPIYIPEGEYYLDGDHAIELYSDVHGDGATLIVGDSHFGDSNPVFEYVHDSETEVVDGVLSDVLIDNQTVTSDYADKFCVIDTLMAYGTASVPNASDNETIKEICVAKGTATEIYFTDDVSSYLTDTIKIRHVSDLNEQGYVFEGVTVKQKTENSYGISLLRISRHNMIIRDIQMQANNDLGTGSVFYVNYSNNIHINNITSYSKQPSDSWGYEFGMYYCSNIMMDNVFGYNDWSFAGTRGTKNHVLTNSIVPSFGCHWNNFGDFIAENCTIFKAVGIGYGTGRLIVKNCTCDYIYPRTDYPQIWYGDIIVEDVNTQQGLWVWIKEPNTGYNAFFNEVKLPNVRIKNMPVEISDKHVLQIHIPDTIESRITSNYLFVIENTELHNLKVDYSNVKYNMIVRGAYCVSGTLGILTSLRKFANVIEYDAYNSYNNVTFLLTGTTTEELTTPSNSVHPYLVRYNGIQRDTTPASNQVGSIVRVHDKNDDTLSNVSLFRYASGVNELRLGVYDADGNSNTCAVRKSGTVNEFNPFSDNVTNLGSSSSRWKQLYAGTTTISTSDERLKDNIVSIPDAVLDAWGEVGWYQYQFKDSIAEKGETKARIHTGAIAQRIESVFNAHGLDANKYGLLCYDEWQYEPAERDEDGNIIQEARPAGNRYSLRYEEALCMEAAYQRRRADRLESRIEALEMAINNAL